MRAERWKGREVGKIGEVRKLYRINQDLWRTMRYMEKKGAKGGIMRWVEQNKYNAFYIEA